MSKYSRFAVLFTLVFLLTQTQRPASGCSSRAVPKPRPSTSSSSVSATPMTTTHAPPTTTATSTTSTTTTAPRPNITFPTYKCPTTYDTYYCLNEATCFSIKIGDSIMYNCECANGFMGQRCEYKELDGSYLPKRPRPILENASIASGATCALLFVLFICLSLYLRYDQKTKSFGFDDDSYLSKCRYCNDKRCCGDADLVRDVDKHRSDSSVLRQHIETIPMSFAIKRTTKL